MSLLVPLFIFFFQAEDGIRDYKVTGSDVCSSDLDRFEQLRRGAVAALQGFGNGGVIFVRAADRLLEDRRVGGDAFDAVLVDQPLQVALGDKARSEERRVGKEWRSGWAPNASTADV